MSRQVSSAVFGNGKGSVGEGVDMLSDDWKPPDSSSIGNCLLFFECNSTAIRTNGGVEMSNDVLPPIVSTKVRDTEIHSHLIRKNHRAT